MITLEHFRATLPEAIGDNQVLQLAFLHHCFPENYHAEEVSVCREAFPFMSFKIVAADGYLAAKGVSRAVAQFQDGMAWLLQIPMPVDLPAHASALLGLAVGTHAPGALDTRAWWQALLVEVRRRDTALASMLEVVLKYRSLVLDAAEMDARLLAVGLMAEPRQFEPQALARFLTFKRKEPFPYSPDFFQNVLSIYVMDAALSIAICTDGERKAESEQAVSRALAEQFQKTKAALQKQAEWRARAWVSGLAIGGLILIVSSCTWFFVWDQDAVQIRGHWKQAEWAFFLLSGPVAAVLTLTRILYFLLQGRKLNVDLRSLADRLRTCFLRRWQRRLQLPVDLVAKPNN